MLAGVSVTWYTWLEQGRPINVSRDVLDALARTMRLDDAEHDHLLALASDRSSDRSADAPATDATDATEALGRLLAAMEPAPAYVLGPRWEFLAWNRAQARLYPPIDRLEGVERNLVWAVMADPTTRDLLVDWDGQARRIVAEFRAGTALLRADPLVDELVGRLQAASAEFATWWPAHDVARFQTRLRAYQHPRAGRLVFEYQQLTPSEWPNLRVVCQLAVPGDDSAERLAAWHEIA